MAPPNDNFLHLGFRFEPTPTQAVTYYLPRLIAGEPMHAAIRPFIHATDIYACEPGVLAAQFCPTPRTGDRFFFTTCKQQQQKAGSKSSRVVRFAGPGSWHSHGSSADVRDGAGVKIGEVKKLRYKKGGAWTDWLMDEFSCCCSEGSVVGDKQYVLCKVYVSPRAGPDSAARLESDVIFAPPPEEPIAAAHNKRKAPPVAEPSCPKRIRPPVVQPPPPSCVLPRIGTAPSLTERSAANLAQPPLPSCVPPRIGTAPSVMTQRPASASNLAQPAIVPMVRDCHMPVQAPPVAEPSCPKRIQAPVVQPPPPFRAPLPRIGMTPSVTQHPASNRAREPAGARGKRPVCRCNGSGREHDDARLLDETVWSFDGTSTWGLTPVNLSADKVL